APSRRPAHRRRAGARAAHRFGPRPDLSLTYHPTVHRPPPAESAAVDSAFAVEPRLVRSTPPENRMQPRTDPSDRDDPPSAARGPAGAWYVDPYYHGDDSLYVSYRAADLAPDPHGGFVEREPLTTTSAATRPFGFSLNLDGPLVSLRTYRLALVSDPAYASYHG